MISKTKKIALLTTGLVGALVTSSLVGVALSSCSTSTTTVEENTKYNAYINWSDPSTTSNLVIDDNGLVYSDINKTTIIAVVPSNTGTTITIPASVTSITGYNEVLPSGTIISRGAFQPSASTGSGNDIQNGITLNNLISTIKFAPNSKLKSIGANAFKGCSLLKTIDLPSTVTMIGDNAFNGCVVLDSINLTNVEYIGQSAFYNLATSLINPTVNISLSKAVVIANSAFQNSKITSVDLSSNTSLISLGNNAFNGCSSLSGTIDISKATSLLSTGTNTFQNCSNIQVIKLPNSLTTIGDNAFNGCSSISNVIDISGATKLSTIGSNAFANCTNLAGLSYPTSAPISSFGANAFSGCTKLTQLGTVANTFTAPTALTSIAASSLAGTKIQIVDISNMKTATPFVDSSLANMTSLTEVKFNSTISTLPAKLFNGDTSLKSIKLPSTITSVVTNPANNGDINNNQSSAFYGSSLETVDMSEIKSYNTTTTTPDSSTTVPSYLFTDLTSLKNVILKTGTTGIGNNAFQGTSSLVSIREASQTDANYTGYTTTNTLTNIGDYAFAGTGLTSFTTSAIGSGDSSGGTNKATASLRLGSYMFQGATSLKTIDLTNATNSIPIHAFAGTTGLQTIKLPNPSENDKSLTIRDGAFSDVTSLTSIDFSKFNTLNIEVNNFINANALTSIDLSGLTSIPSFISDNRITTFTGLPSSSIVKLSSAINSIANSKVFTQTNTEGTTYTRVSLQYPNGIAPSTSQLVEGVLKDINVLSEVSGDLNLSTIDNLTSLGVNTLFGNANITSLTVSAKGLNSNSNLYTLASEVTAVTPSAPPANEVSHKIFANHINRLDNNQYTTNNVPLGNNSKLTSINFDNFSVKPNTNGPAALQQSTFDAIVKIINSYAYYSPTTQTYVDQNQEESPQPPVDNYQEKSVNFKKWEENNNSWIQADATMSYTPNNSSSGGEVTCTNISLKEIGTETTPDKLTFINGTSKSYELTHNNIKWNLVYNSDNNTLTLMTDSTTPANIYKGFVNSQLSVQVYLKTNSDGTINQSSGLQITMSPKIKLQVNNEKIK